MKAEELRIGNITKQGKIIELKENIARVEYFTTHKRTSLISYQDIEPIELTEEILLKCGFEENKFSHIYEDDTRVSIYVNDNFFFCQIDNVVINNIKHLHQLQNLYWCLTNEELEINLQ